MKKFLLLLMLLANFVISLNAQLPYSWVNGVNPGWTSSNPSNRTLGWQNCAGVVSTSNCNGSGGWFRYNNGQNTTYTSSIINTTCSLSSKVRIQINLDVYLENGYDYLYFEYSLNGGTTWTTQSSFTGSFIGNVDYMIPESTDSRYRFRFVSDVNVNSDGYYIYYADVKGFSINCISVLPVELISFEVECGGDVPILIWSTASEQNSDYFQIEKTRDGIDWTIIDKISAAGNSSAINNYQFYDASSGYFEGYYRIKQVDINGEFEYFEPKYFSCKDNGSLYSEVFPNPTSNELYVGIRNNTQEDVTIKIVDNTGKTIDEIYSQTTNGYSIKAVDLSKYMNGLYFIHIITEDNEYVHKVIKK